MVLKVIELLSYSPKSWEDAAQQAVNEAAQTVKNIKSIYIADQYARVDKDKIVEYRINARVTFGVEHFLPVKASSKK